MRGNREEAVIQREARERQEERARLRHARRVRNQLISYLVVAVVLVAVVASAYIGGTKLIGVIAERRVAAEMAAEAEAAELETAKQEEDAAEAEAIEQLSVTLTPETTVEEIPEEPVKTDEELLDEFVETVIADLSLKDKVAGLFLVTPEQLTGVDAAIKAGDGTEEALQETAVGGLVYAQKNIKSSDQISEMLSKTSSMSKYPVFLMTSEPGGKAGELTKALSLDAVSAPAELAESGDTAAAYEAGKALAKRLVDAGFNADLVPFANLTTAAMSDSARETSFGSDPNAASQLLAEMVRGLEENGIRTLVSLFPTSADETDGNIPTTDATLAELAEGDFRMFSAATGAGTRMVMVGNLAVPAVTGDNTPASMSGAIITNELRGSLGFDGVVVTDAMDDAVVTDYYTADQAAVAALKAGADMIYRPEDLGEALDGVIDAVNSGVLSEDRIDESLKRIYRVKYADRFGSL